MTCVHTMATPITAVRRVSASHNSHFQQPLTWLARHRRNGCGSSRANRWSRIISFVTTSPGLCRLLLTVKYIQNPARIPTNSVCDNNLQKHTRSKETRRETYSRHALRWGRRRACPRWLASPTPRCRFAPARPFDSCSIAGCTRTEWSPAPARRSSRGSRLTTKSNIAAPNYNVGQHPHKNLDMDERRTHARRTW
jgi:hypothetical protein